MVGYKWMIKNKYFKRTLIYLLIIIGLIIILLIVLRLAYGGNITMENTNFEELTVTSEAFESEQSIPIMYTGRGDDISPSLKLSKISTDAKSIAIIMDDIDHPPFGIFNHWVIWNIPVQDTIPQDIPHGAVVETLGGAVQGNGYGKHRYRGPKPPFGSHRYKFNVYVLDCELDLDSNSGKKELIKCMDGHVIQYGYLIGKFK